MLVAFTRPRSDDVPAVPRGGSVFIMLFKLQLALMDDENITLVVK